MVDEELEQTQVENVSEEDGLLPSYLANDKLTLADFKKHLSGPLLSTVFHVIVLIVACTVVVQEAPQPEREEIVVEMKEVEPVPPPPPPPPPETPVEVSELAEPTDIPMDRPTVEPTAVTLSPSTDAIADVSTNSAVADVNMSQVNLTAPVSNSKLKISGLYAARSGARRMSFVKQYGGSPATEAAVTKALKWLATVQNEDGSWGDTDPAYAYHTVQLTCLALLAYLAHGDTPQSADYGDAILKGLKLVSQWAETAYKHGGVIRGDWYAHARVGIVLAEGFAITRIPALERAMNKAIETLVKRMNPVGGYYSYYDHKKKETIHTADLDLDSRIYNALYSAFAAGCEVQGLPEAVDLALKCIGEVHKCADGGFSRHMVRRAKNSKGIFEDTAGGTLYMYLMGGGESKSAREGLTWLENYRPGGKDNSELKMDWKNLPGTMSILGWYYMTQALFQGYAGKGSNWKRWNASMINSLVREQHPKGYWPCPADKYPVFIEVIDKETGKKHKEEKVMPESSFGGFSELNGKIWATVYFCMSLEVYYRYLPTFTVGKVKAPSAQKEAEAKAIEEEEDLSLD